MLNILAGFLTSGCVAPQSLIATDMLLRCALPEAKTPAPILINLFFLGSLDEKKRGLKTFTVDHRPSLKQSLPTLGEVAEWSKAALC